MLTDLADLRKPNPKSQWEDEKQPDLQPKHPLSALSTKTQEFTNPHTLKVQEKKDLK
jgi:hypothetical protein